MAKLTLNNITSGFASTTATNANNNLIEAALENTLSRDGTSPNTMSADLDMNGNDILNVADMLVGGVGLAASVTSAAADAASALSSKNAAAVSETNAGVSEVNAGISAAIVADWDYTGAWVTSTAYLVNNIVYESDNGASYICLVAHTSGTFATDLGAAKWGLLATRGAAGEGTGDMLKSENLSGLANYTTAHSNLGLSIGTNVQAYDAQLTTLAGITAQQATDLAAVSTFMGTVLDDADAATARATLGIVAGTGQVVKVTRHTSGTLHTFDASCNSYFMILRGAGGSGAKGPGAGGGGGGAETISAVLAKGGATLDFVIGAGGAAVSGTSINGNAGGTTSALSATYTAPGGGGGQYTSVTGSSCRGGVGGVAGLAPTGFSKPGAAGGSAVYYGSITQGQSGGGESAGQGGGPSANDGVAGGFGSGGGGTSGTTSGAGGGGYVEIWELT